jgi:glycosyltransferase involved in cell wall biosynthesis
VDDSFTERSWIALLGRRDVPTDGVEDYCTFLGQALERRGVELERVRVAWNEMGWTHALTRLGSQAADWRGRWVLLQYTALGWSRHGFPIPALATLKTLKSRGARVAVVFHEHYRQAESARNWIDQIRGMCQDWVIRRLYEDSQKCIFADPLEKIDWLPRDGAKSAFIPIGANMPEAVPPQDNYVEQNGPPKTVAVFGVTDQANCHRERELADISHAVHAAAANGMHLKLLLMGRGSTEAGETISQALRDTPAEVSTTGLLSAEKLAENLAASDAMLFVRGKIHPRRGSVMAAIACGMPIVGYAGMAEGTPLVEAGVELVPYGDRDALGAALTRILTDANLRRTLRQKSVYAQRKYFRWDTIAATFVRFLEAG